MHSENLIQGDVASVTQNEDNRADREDRRDERYEQEE